jgi:hypothetical protein
LSVNGFYIWNAESSPFGRKVAVALLQVTVDKPRMISSAALRPISCLRRRLSVASSYTMLPMAGAVASLLLDVKIGQVVAENRNNAK